MSALSIIIPSRNADNLMQCVEMIRRNEPDFRIIVVDDGLDLSGADAGSPSGCWLCGADPTLRVAGIKPFVFSRNVNLGIKAAGADDVILLNDDALLMVRGGFSKMQQQHYLHPEFGLIGSSLDSCGTATQHRRPGLSLREEPVMVVFACVFLPRSTIDRIGLLDERFGLNAGGAGVRGYGCEDDDYSWRVRREGLKLGVYDGCFVNHTMLPSTFRQDPEHPADVVAHERLFAQKWGRSPRNP